MRVDFNNSQNNQVFGKNLYVKYPKNLIGQTNLFYAQIIDFVRPQLEAMTKNTDRYLDCDMFISANNKGVFKILIGDNLSSPIKRLLPDSSSTVKVKFSTNDIHTHYIADKIIEQAQKAKEKFLKIPNYFTRSW